MWSFDQGRLKEEPESERRCGEFLDGLPYEQCARVRPATARGSKKENLFVRFNGKSIIGTLRDVDQARTLARFLRRACEETPQGKTEIGQTHL